jgi:sulfide:quinone oxidoreductase
MAQKLHHRVLIVGGGSAGITTAARLIRDGHTDVAILEPSDRHFYQPLWTLVGAGLVRREETLRAQSRVMPSGATWIREGAAEIDPDSNAVVTSAGNRITYDFLIVTPGLVLDWNAIPGMREAVESGSASTNYSYDLAPQTWEMIKNFRGGVVLFHMPGTPVKCPGAPQKIMYLAADNFRRRGILDSSKVIYGSALPGIYGVKEYAAVLSKVVERYGIDARYNLDLVEINPEKREAIYARKTDPVGERMTIPYDIAHFVPPQKAPDFIRNSALPPVANPGLGWVEVDQYSMQHKRFSNIFALGDVAGTPNAKTGAAAAKQAPVVVANLSSVMRGAEPVARYDGYVACPITTAQGKMLLCEFDYTLKPTPTVPFINSTKERYDMWILKRHGLPWIYWNVMLRGRDVPFLKARNFATSPPTPTVAPAAGR